VSRYQKGKNQEGKNQSGFTGARDSEWQWHLLSHMQVCSSSQITTPTFHHSVGINLKELGGQMSKCLKFCTGIEILNRFSLKNDRL